MIWDVKFKQDSGWLLSCKVARTVTWRQFIHCFVLEAAEPADGVFTSYCSAGHMPYLCQVSLKASDVATLEPRLCLAIFKCRVSVTEF